MVGLPHLNKLIIEGTLKMARYVCESCMNMLESIDVHDYIPCPGTTKGPCENETFVDGGNEYNRYGGKDLRKITVLDYVDHTNSKSRLKRLETQKQDEENELSALEGWPY